METVTLSDEKFDEISSLIEAVHMPEDGYVPSEMDMFDYVESHPEKYYKYLLWFCEHKPETESEEKKKRIKEIVKITNRTIKLV